MDVYRHFGSNEFDINRFMPISNREHWIKPHGGLWAEPIRPGARGWREWCEIENYNVESLDSWFDFNLDNKSKVFKIEQEQNLNELSNMGCCELKKNPFSSIARESNIDAEFIDFEKLLNIGYDAVEVEINPFTYWALYGWDCDSIVVLNPKVIIPNRKDHDD